MMEKAAILFAFVGVANGQIWEDCQEGCPGNVTDGLYVDMRLVGGDKVQFDVVTLDNTWFGMILGGHRMSAYPNDATDIIAFSANGSESYCSDFWTAVQG